MEAHAVDRAHRIGQTRQVFAYRLITRDTVEEKCSSYRKPSVIWPTRSSARTTASSPTCVQMTSHSSFRSAPAGSRRNCDEAAAAFGPTKSPMPFSIGFLPRQRDSSKPDAVHSERDRVTTGPSRARLLPTLPTSGAGWPDGSAVAQNYLWLGGFTLAISGDVGFCQSRGGESIRQHFIDRAYIHHSEAAVKCR